MEVLASIPSFIQRYGQTALCVIISTSGSTPRKAGSKMLVAASGETMGSVGGGQAEMKVIEAAIDAIRERKIVFETFIRTESTVIEEPATMDIYIEPMRNSSKLYIFGGGHVGMALAEVACRTGFDVTVIDPRNLPVQQSSKCFKLVKVEYLDAVDQLHFDMDTFVAIMTPDHTTDFELLKLVGQKETHYLGMIGSTRKADKAREVLRSSGLIAEARIRQIDSPMGISIGAQTPEEISISILGRLIQVRNG